MKKLFGTDGIRAEANIGLMQPIEILKIAQAVGSYFMQHNPVLGDHKPTVVIGKDTRLSGYMVESALQAGFLSVGMNVLLVGPLPTPAIALLTRSFRAQLGVMISASHNPAKDNGIKFFSPDGNKLTDQQEEAITEIYYNHTTTLAHAYDIGKAKRIEDAAGRYLEYVKNTCPKDVRLNHLKIVVDCANGAAYKIAPRLYWELGADVITLHHQPNGVNINQECGATHLDSLQQAVIEHKADIGFALDGDADRLIAVDENGQILDGDKLIGAIAQDMKENNELFNNIVVTTQMSNLGLEKFLQQQHIQLIRSKVGDRYVLEDMDKHAASLGGEQSGHIILKQHTSTGDGLLASLKILKCLVRKKQKASMLHNLFQMIPQKLVNVKQKATILQQTHVQEVIEQNQKLLGQQGRIFIRPSGTEPLIRVMIESEDEEKLHMAMTNILHSLEQAIP